MQTFSQLWIAITSLTRQFLNCWLEYVLSQPVDFDISVMLQFLRSYLGISFIQSLIESRTTQVEATFEDEKLIPQESYS